MTPAPKPAEPVESRAAGFVAKPLRGYRCEECGSVTHLSDLNDDLLCEACAGPFVDEGSVIDCSVAAMRREHGTWGL